MALCPRITVYPGLGKVTVLEPGQTEVDVTAVIEWERDRQYPFECEFLYADAGAKTHPSSWTRIGLPSSSVQAAVIQQGDDECQRAWFTTTLKLDDLAGVHKADGSAHIAFTAQHRQNKFDTWQLARVPAGVEVGEFVLPSKSQEAESLENVLQLEPGWTSTRITATDGVETWQIATTDVIETSHQDDVILNPRTLGKIKNQLRFMAITRIEPFWFGCEHDRDYFYLSNDAVLLSFLTTTGQCITMLAFNGDDDFYTVFKGGNNGSIEVCSRNDSPNSTPARVLVAVSQDKQKSIAAVMSHARDIASAAPKLESLIKTALQQGKTSAEDAFFDNFGFCTWNALGQDLTRDKVLNGLDKLAESGVHFNTLLLDDNWQSLGKTKLDYSCPGFRGWSRFEANEDFPGGLSGLISEIKAKYPHIQYVGVWHALFGYWAGLSHDSEFAKTYKTRMVRAKVRYLTPTDVLIIDPSEIHRFYDDFYHFLRNSGVDFIKTDVQHMLGNLIDPADRSDVPSAYQSAWTAAYTKHFDGRAISCMSQIPQISFHSFLQNKTPKIQLRNSDDFFPEIPGSHPFHLFVNAHNALLTQHLNCIPDWDMFQTNHAYSHYHAASRALSGGPILITDTPGSHSLPLIHTMTALSPRSKHTRIAIRPRLATVAAQPRSGSGSWSSYADGQILRIAAETDGDGRLLGVFNVAEGRREGLVGVGEIVGAEDREGKGKWVVRSYATGQVFVPKARGPEALVKVKLEVRGWDVLSAVSVLGVKGGEVAVLGLVDKIAGAAAVVEVYGSEEEEVVLRLKALGKLGVYVLRGEMRPVGFEDGGAVAGGEGRLWIRDLEKEWTEKDLWDGRNVVDVRIGFEAV